MASAVSLFELSFPPEMCRDGDREEVRVEGGEVADRVGEEGERGGGREREGGRQTDRQTDTDSQPA